MKKFNPILVEVWNYVSCRGGSICPTYTQCSFSALKPPKGQKSCFHISLGQIQLIWAFLGFFSHKSQKRMQKLKILPKIAKKWVKFQNFEWVFKIWVSFQNFEWVFFWMSFQILSEFSQTPQFLSGTRLKFWNFEALIWVVSIHAKSGG